MKEIANWALNVATMRGASYADARIVGRRSRALTTKNGKVGSASDAESTGLSVRVLADERGGSLLPKICRVLTLKPRLLAPSKSPAPRRK